MVVAVFGFCAVVIVCLVVLGVDFSISNIVVVVVVVVVGAVVVGGVVIVIFLLGFLFSL